MTSAFLLPAEQYKRSIDPINEYLNQTSFYLSKITHKSLEECKTDLRSIVNKKELRAPINPIVTHYCRDGNKDTHLSEIPLSQYLKDSIANNDIIAPSFTTYLSEEVEVSLLAEFADQNKKDRSKSKKEAAEAKASGNLEVFEFKNNEQDNKKRANNSLSGGFCSGSTILVNPSAHSTLTSMTRTLTSIGNASNERVISGNRHYRNPDITLNNLVSIASDFDRVLLDHVITKYNLKYPTIQDTMNCVTYSSDFYWNDRKALSTIHEFVSSLTDIERAAVVYIGDFYHLRLLNPDIIRVFITKLSRKVSGNIENPIDYIYKCDEQIVNYVHQICMDEVRGIGKKYSELSIENQQIVANTCKNVFDVVTEHKDLIQAIFLTKHLPPSVGYISNMLRRTVVVSDTDSTMFSVDEWVEWYFGKLQFDSEAFAVAGAVTYIATQSIAHNLAIYSANIGVAPKKKFTLAMKPEYVFPVFAQTPVAKHYYTCIAIKEGSVFKEIEMEIKGVHMKSSAAPRHIVKATADKMKSILLKIMNGEKLSLKDEITDVANIERDIRENIIKGNVDYFKRDKIKEPTAYSLPPEQSPYARHVFWNSVFGGKYGNVPEPPYQVVKVPTIVNNITQLKNWVESIRDEGVKDRLQNWLIANNKRELPTIYISMDYIRSNGLPEEIISIVNLKRITLDLTLTNRIILETLGYIPKTETLITEYEFWA